MVKQTNLATAPAQPNTAPVPRQALHPNTLSLERLGALAFFGALLLISAWAVFTLVGGVNFRDIEQRLQDGDPGKLKTPILAQSFVSSHGNLSGVELQLAPPIPTTLPADMRAMLVRAEGLDNLSLGETVFGIPKIISATSGSYLSVSFPPIHDSRGATYTFMLATPGYSVNSILRPTWSTADVLSSGAMYTEDGPQSGDLGITTYYCYTFSTLLSDVWYAVTGNIPMILVWLALLLLPGLALLLWLPNNLNTGQCLLAAPALSALLLPVIFLLASLINLPIGPNKLWALLALCALAVTVRVVLGRRRTKDEGRRMNDYGRPSSATAFWLSFAAVLTFTAITRLISLRDLEAGVGMDAYHHTLITALFLRESGIPSGYEPFVPLASFTYHFGFHTLSAAIAWLTGNTQATDLMTLIPQVGQVAGSVLPIPALTLFGWRVLGNRWLGLAAAALAGLVSVVPAFYTEWSRYTQGLGLAVLPVVWVLFVEAVRSKTTDDRRPTTDDRPTLSRIFRPSAFGLRQYSTIALAALASVGLFLTHYRITVIYVAFAILYVLWSTFTEASSDGTPAIAFRASRFAFYVSRAALIALVSLVLLLPWLLNFVTNFRTNFTGRENLDADTYYATAERLGYAVLSHPSLPLLTALAALGMAMLGRRLWQHSFAGLALGSLVGLIAFGFSLYIWLSDDPQRLEFYLQTNFLGLSPVTWFLVVEIIALCALLISGVIRSTRGVVAREAIVALPALAWLVLALWSSPQLFPRPFRLPYAGYLDAVTLASGAWLPVCLLASYALVNTCRWTARLVTNKSWLMRGKRWPVDGPILPAGRAQSVVLAATIATLALACLASGMKLAPITERGPYIGPADKEALVWMRDNLPRYSFVLANSFNFPWSPAQTLGLDAGLWVPLVAGVRSSVPPINAYNEKPADDHYFNQVLELAAIKRVPVSAIDWQALKEQGVTHVFIGSRAVGIGFSAPDLLKDPHVEIIFHRDGVWLFSIRDQGSGIRGQSGSQVLTPGP